MFLFRFDMVPVEDINIIDSTIYQSDHTIHVSDEILLVAEIVPQNATNQEVTWSSSNPDIVSVIDGKFQVNGIGEVTLTCSAYGDISKSIDIHIVDDAVVAVAVDTADVADAGSDSTANNWIFNAYLIVATCVVVVGGIIIGIMIYMIKKKNK